MKIDQLYPVERADAGKLSELLTQCFAQDPLYCQLIPQQPMRNRLLPGIFNCDLDELFQTCHVYADSPEVNGIIIVSDETEPQSPVRRCVIEAFAALKTMALLLEEDPSLKTLWNFIKGQEYLNSEWTEDLGELPRLHVVYFAVRPSKRGQGVASKLMKAVLAYADANGRMVSLETHNQHNLKLYQHYGFQLFEVVRKHFPLKQFCMIRPSAAAQDTLAAS